MYERILRELRNHSNGVFNNLNIELSSILNTDFEEYLDKSAKRMVREGKTSDSDLIKAKEAYTTFINKMYPYRETRSGQKDLVRLVALNESKSSICPLWPIC